MGEQTKEAVGKLKNVDDLILRLNNVGKAILEQTDEKIAKKYRFNVQQETEPEQGGGKTSYLEKWGLNVNVYEDIDIKDASKKSKFYIRISNIDKCYVDIDLFEYRDIVLNYDYFESEYIFKRLEKILGIGTEEFSAVCNEISDYLSEVCYDKERQVKAYSELGWDTYDGKRIFKYDKIYSDLGQPEIVSECNSEVAEFLSDKDYSLEKLEGWLEYTGALINYSDTDALIISTACTGIIRQLLPYTKETNINMNIVGQRASGKSTICHFALSLFGDPSVLEGSFTDTDNAMEMLRSKRPILPYILDERMLKFEGSSDNARRQGILLGIFREYEGKAKEKLAGQGKELSGKRTYGPIMSTSVEPMLDMLLKGRDRDIGQYRRFIELEVEASELFDGALMAEETEEVAYTCYGYGIEVLIRYIFSCFHNNVKIGIKGEESKYKIIDEYNENYIADLYNQISECVGIILDQVEWKQELKGMLRSSAKRFALIITAFEVLSEAVNERMMLKVIKLVHKTQEGQQGWLRENLDDVNWNEVCTKHPNLKNVKYMEKSYLGASLLNIISSKPKDVYSKSENVLGVLIDNLVEKMRRLEPDIDVFSNIEKFIKIHPDLFYTEERQWDGKGEYIGKLKETADQSIIQIRVKKGFEWILVYGAKLEDVQLKEYINKSVGMQLNSWKPEIEKLFGNVYTDSFERAIRRHKEIEYISSGKFGANNVTLAQISINHRMISTENMRDSDKEK